VRKTIKGAYTIRLPVAIIPHLIEGCPFLRTKIKAENNGECGYYVRLGGKVKGEAPSPGPGLR